MNILYFIPHLSQAGGGVRQYACALLQILAMDRQNRYFILHTETDPLIQTTLEKNPHLTLIPPEAAAERPYEKWYSAVMKSANLLLELKPSERRIPVWSYVERLRKRYRIDVVHCPYAYTPYTKAHTVTTIHDVQELHFPEFFSAAERAHRALFYKQITERSEQIVVSYQHIKDDLIRYFGRTPDNVQVCLLDMQYLWFDELARQKVEVPLPTGVQHPYVLYPAATWPHKNHLGLLRALAHARDTYDLTIHLVCTGHQTAHFETIRQQVADLHLEQQVSFPGIVSDQTLYSLYQHARAVVVPTQYEAGSFPLMESLLMGIPVICSDVTSLPETIGDNRFTFDPYKTDDMTEKLVRIVQDEGYRQQNLDIGRQQAERLKNTHALGKLQRLYASFEPQPPVAAHAS